MVCTSFVCIWCTVEHSCSAIIACLACAVQMGLRGFRVYSWSPMEQRAFGPFWYETKKKCAYHARNIGSTYLTMLPSFSGMYLLIKWAEGKMASEHLHHRD